MNEFNNNPFQITSPEGLTAEETVKLFVDVFTDFYQITNPGHVIIKGPRGVGKSMMFRYLQPDCQCLATQRKLNELPYIAVYVPVKNTNFLLTELRRFDNKHASAIINEHLMVTHCIVKILSDIKACVSNDIEDFNRIKSFYVDGFCSILGFEVDSDYEKFNTIKLFDLMLKQINRLYKKIVTYIKQSSFSVDFQPYYDALYDFNDYLVPLLESLSSMISDNNPTIYLLFDDAHYLSELQTKILNTWVASRISRKVSLKISTQYNYKTYYTINGATIDTPHDYVELDFTTIYTEANKTSKSTYYKRINDIVTRRLKLNNISLSPEQFFPEDLEQKKQIEIIRNQYIERYERGEGRGTNKTDDANRYARPDYIKSLGGISKSSYTYNYAGFDQLVNISSGVVRYFLHQAHTMYAKQQSINENGLVDYISPSVQSDVVREIANNALYNELESYKIGEDCAYPTEEIQKLYNLIQGLGGVFRKILLSDCSERRVFSVAITDEISAQVKKVFNIGIELGYFYKSTIGRKEAGSIGRTILYVLSRRLAPIWSLDPNGFAGYRFVKNRFIEALINDPIQTVSHFNPVPKGKADSKQITMFDIIDIGGSDDED